MSAARRRKGGRNKPNATGRSRYQRHIQLTYHLLETAAYRSLSPTARALLIELSMLYNGDNNGSLYLSVRDSAARLGLGSLASAQDALDELQDAGFISMIRDAHFSVKTGEHSRARTWRLNWLAGPGRRMPDLKLFEWQPLPQTRARKRMERGLRALKAYRKRKNGDYFPVSESVTPSDLPARSFIKPVADFGTAITENRAFPANDVVPDSATYIDHHGCLTAECGSFFVGWWKSDQTNLIARIMYPRLLVGRLQHEIDQPLRAA